MSPPRARSRGRKRRVSRALHRIGGGLAFFDPLSFPQELGATWRKKEQPLPNSQAFLQKPRAQLLSTDLWKLIALLLRGGLALTFPPCKLGEMPACSCHQAAQPACLPKATCLHHGEGREGNLLVSWMSVHCSCSPRQTSGRLQFLRAHSFTRKTPEVGLCQFSQGYEMLSRNRLGPLPSPSCPCTTPAAPWSQPSDSSSHH